METSKSLSFFQNLSSRELNGSRVRKRPRVGGDIAFSFKEVGTIAVEHNGDQTPPLAASFCKTFKNSHIFAISDEDGYVSLFDTRNETSSSSSHQENSEKTRVCDWVAHQNAVFDICWLKEDTRMITASGDQTMKLWDIQERKCTGTLKGHRGSVKSITPHPTNHDVVVSCSRDGSFALWDLRSNSCSKDGIDEPCLRATAVVKGAHLSPFSKRARRLKSASKSITSILYLKDELTIATAGAADNIVKFWDTRNLKSAITSRHPQQSDMESRLHGISSLSQDASGTFLSASCMDSRIYLYNLLQPEKDPINSFSGCRIDSFFVKAAISPDASYILSGSTDGNAHVWQVNKPQEDPIILSNHDGEVSAVDWCSFETGKFVTSSDDFTVRIWNAEINNSSSSKKPTTSAIRKRIMAMPAIEPSKESAFLCSSDEEMPKTPSVPDFVPKMGSPEASFEKTPEAFLKKSPSSVFNTSSSLKRKTIRDYFLAAS